MNVIFVFQPSEVLMKKLIPFFIFIICCTPFCRAQDTLYLRDGSKMGVKIISADEQIVYSIPPSDSQRSISPSKVNYIKYKDGVRYTLSGRADTISEYKKNVSGVKIVCKPYLLVSGGGSLPFYDYGTDVYGTQYVGYDEYQYQGYASHGYTVSLTGGLVFNQGWEVTGKFSYFNHGFDATGYMNQNAAFYLQNTYTNNGNENILVNNVNAVGTYNYTITSALIGVTKSWQSGTVSFGISMMIGEMTSEIPAVQGIAQTDVGGSNNENCNLYIGSNQDIGFDFEMGAHMDVKISHRFFIRAMADIEMSRAVINSGYQLTDMSGNVLVTGNLGTLPYSGGDSIAGFGIGIANLTLGVGYEL